jgi:phage terminase small subunit
VTVQHQRFVDEYAKDGNATAAYKRAGYRATGHSAEVNASRLAHRPDVAAAAKALFEQHLAAIRQRAAPRPIWIRIRGSHGILVP